MTIETLGIRHVHLLVSDHARSVAFYKQVFGMEVGFSSLSALRTRHICRTSGQLPGAEALGVIAW